jgi:hypothetical protein
MRVLNLWSYCSIGRLLLDLSVFGGVFFLPGTGPDLSKWNASELYKAKRRRAIGRKCFVVYAIAVAR